MWSALAFCKPPAGASGCNDAISAAAMAGGDAFSASLCYRVEKSPPLRQKRVDKASRIPVK